MGKISARRLCISALMCATAVIISAVEGILPVLPMMPPGTKAGLSNVIVMFCAIEIGLPSAVAVVLFKACFAFITRGFLAALMSLAGGLLSLAVVYISAKSRFTGLIGVGVSGAAAHNTAQLILSYFIVGEAIVFYAPVMMITAVLSGVATALLLRLVSPAMNRLLKEGGER